MKLSILLPTLFPELAAVAIRRLEMCTVGVDYEIVVVSPQEVFGRNVVWVREDSPAGGVAAAVLAFQHATGDFVAVLTDDMRVEPYWAEVVLAQALAGEAKSPGPYLCGISTCGFGLAFGLCFPFFTFARRETVAAIGGLYRPHLFRSFFADPDLGMRAWDAGGRVEFAKGTFLTGFPRGETPESLGKFKSYDSDVRSFLAQWGRKYGATFDLSRVRHWQVEIHHEAVQYLPDDYQRMITRDSTFNINDGSTIEPVRLSLVKHYGEAWAEAYMAGCDHANVTGWEDLPNESEPGFGHMQSRG